MEIFYKRNEIKYEKKGINGIVNYMFIYSVNKHC